MNNIKNILFLDWETYYDASTYTLRKMTTPEYILDERFEPILCAVAVNDQPSVIVDGPDFGDFISKYDPETTATVTYNALFDNSILSWCYGWTPKLMLDSMNIARALRGHILPNLKLATVAPILLNKTKGDTIVRVSGMRREQIKANPELWRNFCTYAIDDNDQSRDIFTLLIKELPLSEYRVMDLVIRAAVQPKFMIDKTLLDGFLNDIRFLKADLIMECDPVRFNKQDPAYSALRHDIATSDEARKMAVKGVGLMSTKGFQEALERHGVEVEYKTSQATGKLTPAFAKTDQFMEDLQEHPDPQVQALACARLGVKSTLLERRCEKMIKIASCPWHHYRDGNPRFYSGGEMPIPLKYGGAHTHRLSGDWGLNMQNLPRGSKLRKALLAPPGYMVVAGDLAQIEARLVAWLAGCLSLLSTFSTPSNKRGDPYSVFASIIFGYLVDRNFVDPATGKKPHTVEGFIGKTGILGLGFGCGEDNFYTMVVTLARLLGVKIDGTTGVLFDKALAKKTVYDYRHKYFEIPELWNKLDIAVRSCWMIPTRSEMRVGPVTISYGCITGPGDLRMQYEDPHCEFVAMRNGNDAYIYKYGPKRHLMYGAKMLENIIQFLARVIIMNAALRLECRGYRFVLQAHDELAFIVPDHDVDNAKKIIYQELTRPPSWGKDIPLNAEVKSGRSYGDCK